jgi:hypothetical protein
MKFTFLKKHYEKIILTILLVIFVLSLVYQIKIISQSLNITQDDLKLPRKEADYKRQKVDLEKTDYNFIKELDKNIEWQKSGPREKDAKYFTDLMICFPAARSQTDPQKRIMPVYYFQSGVDEFTGDKIDKPEIAMSNSAEKDTDGDGMPDKIEAELGLNPNNPNDAFYDPDNDGFANIDEIKYKTDIKNPKSHPPLALRLTIAKIERTKLNVRLKKLHRESEDKSTWEARMDVWENKTWKSKFSKMNDFIKIDGEEYKVTGMEYKTVKEENKRLKTFEDREVSEVTLVPKDSGPEENVIVKIGETAYAPKEKITFKDSLGSRLIRTSMNTEFQVGDNNTGVETYKVIAVQAENKNEIVKVKRAGDGVEVNVLKNKQINDIMMPEGGKGGPPPPPTRDNKAI